MKKIFVFNMPEDKEEYEVHHNAWDMYLALHNMKEDLRRKTKHVDDTATDWSDVKDWFYLMLDD